MLNGHQPRRLVPAILTAGVTVAALVVATPSVGQADPEPTRQSLNQVMAQVDDLEEKAEIATERANELRDEVRQIRARVEALSGDVDRERKAVDELRVQVGQFAAAQYRAGGIDTTTALFLADAPDDFLSRLSTTETVNEQQSGSLAVLRSRQKAFDEKQAAAQAELTRLQQVQSDAKAKRSEADQKLAESRELLARLTAAQRERVRQREAAAERASRSGDRTGGSTGDGTGGEDGPVELPPASGRGATAVAFAKAQLGKPYVFGAAGPGAYDCSGLTMAAWAAAGVSLPHSSRNQYYSVSHKVSISQLQPGDLVIFYSSMHHVGIYVGNGMVIHAPHTGDVVRYAPLSYMPFAGAVRPG